MKNWFSGNDCKSVKFIDKNRGIEFNLLFRDMWFH